MVEGGGEDEPQHMVSAAKGEASSKPVKVLKTANMKEYQKLWRSENPNYSKDCYQRNKAKSQRYYLEKKERRLAQIAAWHAAHPDYAKQWLAKNPNYHKNYQQQRDQANPEAAAIRKQRQKIRVKEYYWNNLERSREKQRIYAARRRKDPVFRAKDLENRRRYYARNRERLLQKEKNPERRARARQCYKIRREKNPEARKKHYWDNVKKFREDGRSFYKKTVIARHICRDLGIDLSEYKGRDRDQLAAHICRELGIWNSIKEERAV